MVIRFRPSLLGKVFDRETSFSLFILVSKCLSILIDKAISDGSFTGIKLPKNGPRISHSLFADDSLFFFNGDLNSCHSLYEILQIYLLEVLSRYSL